MKVELKQIVDELTEAVGLDSNKFKIGAMVDGDRIIGWTTVSVYEDGTMTPIGTKFKNIKEVIQYYGK